MEWLLLLPILPLLALLAWGAVVYVRDRKRDLRQALEALSDQTQQLTISESTGSVQGSGLFLGRAFTIRHDVLGRKNNESYRMTIELDVPQTFDLTIARSAGIHDFVSWLTARTLYDIGDYDVDSEFHIAGSRLDESVHRFLEQADFKERLRQAFQPDVDKLVFKDGKLIVSFVSPELSRLTNSGLVLEHLQNLHALTAAMIQSAIRLAPVDTRKLLLAMSCPFCRDPIAGGDHELIACDKCGTVHHDDCWDGNSGCSVFGCDAALAERIRLEPVGMPLKERV